MKRDYYDILGVGRGADEQTLKRAYRGMARKLHPDVNQDDPNAEAHFKELSEAYQVLSDPQKRAVYDRYGHEGLDGAAGGGAGFGDFGFGDIFDMFFGGSGQRGGRAAGPQRGADLRYDLLITYNEAAFGTDKDIEIPALADCDKCGGTGSASGAHPVKCSRCGGSGELRTQKQTFIGTVINTQTCPQCGGRGKSIPDPCPSCRGAGKKQTRKTVRINIPAGVDSGQKMRLMGEGEPGGLSGPSGDLYVFIFLQEHEFFKRDGQDVFCEVPISVVQASLGDEIEVPTLYGREKLKIPAGTQPGSVFRMREKGFPHLRGQHKGDQHVVVKVLVPTHLNAKQKQALDEFARLTGEDVKSPHKNFFDKMKDLFVN